MSFKSATNKAIGLGSAKSGLHHWIVQRVTAIALIPISLWFVGLFIVLLTAPYQVASLCFTGTLNATLAILFITATFYHGSLGMQVVWEDYVHHEKTKWLLIIATKFVSAFLALISTLSILKIYIG